MGGRREGGRQKERETNIQGFYPHIRLRGCGGEDLKFRALSVNCHQTNEALRAGRWRELPAIHDLFKQVIAPGEKKNQVELIT